MRRRAHLLMPAAGLLLAATAILASIAETPRPGAYTVRVKDGISWLTDADGLAFFSLGLNVVDRGVPRRDYTSAKPAYAAFRLYRTPDAWARVTANRLRRWGINTIGGWSDDEVLQPGGTGPFAATPVLEIGRTLGVPWCDVFADDFAARASALAQRTLAKWQGRRDVIGYFLDNELGWWGDSIFLIALRQPPESRTRARLIAMLRTHYRGDFDRLRRDFETPAATFDALALGGTLQLTADGQGTRVVDAFLQAFAERYYAVTTAAVRRHAPGRLILGDRYVGYYDWPVVRAAAPYVDVISVNQGADWSDGRTSRFFLSTLHALSGKPVLVSELYLAARENRSGNRNTGNLFPTVQTQRARADGARRQLERLADLPFVVGAHWFQYYDEPTYGRPDGEDYNMGLIDIADRPYEEITTAFASLDAQARHARAVAASGGTPTAAAPSAPLTAAGTPLPDWDLDRAFVGPTTIDPHAGAFADAYVSWHPNGFAIALYASAFADPTLYAGRTIAPDAQLVATVSAGEGAARTTMAFGPESAGPSSDARGCQRTRCWTVVPIDAAAIGGAPLTAGRVIPIAVTLTYRGRRMTWTPEVRLVDGRQAAIRFRNAPQTSAPPGSR